MGTDTKTEEMIKDLGADKAPRITPAEIEALVVRTGFLLEPLQQGGMLTICVLHLKNGFTVTGEAAAVSAENYRQEIGERVARQNAINKVWPLAGYDLAQVVSGNRIRREDALAFFDVLAGSGTVEDDRKDYGNKATDAAITMLKAALRLS